MENEEIRAALNEMKVHPTIINLYLTKPDGTVRLPYWDEWHEDYGLGYLNRLAWESKNENLSVTLL